MADIFNKNNGGSSDNGESFNKNEGQNQNQQNNEGNNNNDNSLDKQISDIINQKLAEFQNQINGTITDLQGNAQTLAEQKQKLEVEKLLTESEILDGRFYDFVYSDDLELVKAKIESLENLIKELLNEKVNVIVNERLGASAWIPGGSSNNSTIDTFKKPSYMV